MRYLFLTLLLLIAGCETLLEPELEKEQDATLAHRVVVNDIEMRYYTGDTSWSNWELVSSATTDSVPEDQTLVVQFRQGAFISSIIGFSYPELTTCFVMPAHQEGNTAWRVTFGGTQDLYPGNGRIEIRYDETQVANVRDRSLYVMAELWDNGSQTYISSTPWFSFRFTNLINDRDFHQTP